MSICTLDCHGLVCLHNRIIDLDSCQCECESYASGEECKNLNCSTLSDYGKDITYANVPYECPKFCGLCDRKKYSIDFIT